MKCDELKDYDIMDVEAYDDKRLEESESGKIQVTRVYMKHDVDSAIAELKQKLHDAEMVKDDAEAANTEYREDIRKLKAENESLRKAVSNWHDKYCKLQEKIDNLECKLACVTANKDKEIDELKARITDNSDLIETLSNELEKLRPMETALEIAEADNKKYIARIKELEAAIDELKVKLAEEREFGINRAKCADHDIGKLCEEIKSLRVENERLKDIKEKSFKCAGKAINTIANVELQLRNTKHALWMARALRAEAAYLYWNDLAFHKIYGIVKFNVKRDCGENIKPNQKVHTPYTWADIWDDVRYACTKKAKEYK